MAAVGPRIPALFTAIFKGAICWAATIICVWYSRSVTILGQGLCESAFLLDFGSDLGCAVLVEV